MVTTCADKLLFDRRQFTHNLKQTEQPLQLFKKKLQQGYHYIHERFQAGENIALLVNKQVGFIDELLVLAWQQFITNDSFSLVAVGGYGRCELSLTSDIDLLVLEKRRTSAKDRQQLTQFITFLWDFGLPCGHSVRTIKQCRQEATDDITVMTCIMEARLLCGNKTLYTKMSRMTTAARFWPPGKFFQAKLQEQKIRHARYDDSEYKLEPHIKESPGALRDIHMIYWISKHYCDRRRRNCRGVREFLTAEEHKTLIDCQQSLWRIRFALYIVAQGQEDRLLFEYD